jgi:hypothetical protein
MDELKVVGKTGGVRMGVGVADGLGVALGGSVGVGETVAVGSERVAACSASANTRVISRLGVAAAGAPAQADNPNTASSINSMPATIRFWGRELR